MSNFLTLLGTPTPTTIALRVPGTTWSYSDQDDDTSVSRIWDHDFLRCNKNPMLYTSTQTSPDVYVFIKQRFS